MTNTASSVRVSMEIVLEPSLLFDLVIGELTAALERRGIRFEKGAQGRVLERDTEVGRVVSWKPGEAMTLEWHQADWAPQEITRIELRVKSADGRSTVELEHSGWGRLIGDSAELAGWFADELAAPLLRATAPAAFGDWLTDRMARRPSGAQARAVYRDPLYHYPNFRAILSELALSPDDYLIEVGCGGGAFLKDALPSGCRAAAIDHSTEMVKVARENNQQAIAEGRLEIVEASADQLPFSEAKFTCAAMTGVLGFLPDPVAALAEIRRVLRPGGRVVVLGSDPELKGTPGAPEPMASRLRFYGDKELEALGLKAGLKEVRVIRRDLYDFAKEAGVPEEHLPLFAGPGTRFLLARNIEPNP